MMRFHLVTHVRGIWNEREKGLLALHVKVDAGGRHVLSDILAVKRHLEFGDPRSFHPADALCGFGHRILGGLSEAFLGSTYDFDILLSHGLPHLVFVG